MWGDDHLTIKTLWSEAGHYRSRWGKIIAKKHGICECPLLTSASELILDWVGSKKILGSDIT